jgi:hypothetical protein
LAVTLLAKDARNGAPSSFAMEKWGPAPKTVKIDAAHHFRGKRRFSPA